MEQEPVHRRRPRYRGTHPRRFEQRYKEHEPEKYPQEARHIESKGNTLAGTHRPIMVEEILRLLQPGEGQLFLDVTLGYGGHAQRVLERLGPTGKLVALDADPIELPRTQARLLSLGYDERRLEIRQLNFSGIKSLLVDYPSGFDGVVADLGVSSMQLDNPQRGFSHKHDGPLDLRLNPRQGASAAEFLQRVSQEKLEEILRDFADEPHAEEIARAIKTSPQTLQTTLQLAHCIQRRLGRLHSSEQKKALQRSFMAIRIAVNEEFRALGRFLNALPECLASGGRVAILSFHSGEDRRVKRAFAEGLQSGTYSEVSDGPLLPSPEECRSNPRSTCAKLRWARRCSDS